MQIQEVKVLQLKAREPRSSPPGNPTPGPPPKQDSDLCKGNEPGFPHSLEVTKTSRELYEDVNLTGEVKVIPSPEIKTEWRPKVDLKVIL
jgi:hypothetical protein